MACSSGPINERGVRFWWSRSENLFVLSSNFNFATSRSCFEDYTCIFVRLKDDDFFTIFGPDVAADKSLNVSRRVLKNFCV